MPEVSGYQRFFAELKRRRVFRVMAVYGVVGFVLPGGPFGSPGRFNSFYGPGGGSAAPRSTLC
jgi:hypothetical protein